MKKTTLLLALIYATSCNAQDTLQSKFITEDISKFNKSQFAGNAVQVIGFSAGISALLSDNNQKVRYMAYSSGVLFFIGFIVKQSGHKNLSNAAVRIQSDGFYFNIKYGNGKRKTPR